MENQPKKKTKEDLKASIEAAGVAGVICLILLVISLLITIITFIFSNYSASFKSFIFVVIFFMMVRGFGEKLAKSKQELKELL